MTQRISTEHVQAKVDTVNRMLGFDPETVDWSTDGSVTLYSAYNAMGVHRISGNSGGHSDLMGGLGTKRECANFLNGMIQALRILDKG